MLIWWFGVEGTRVCGARAQRDRFDEEALHLATRLILSDEEACKTSIAEAVRRELLWLAPRGRTVDIRIRRPDVTVTLAEAVEAAS